MKDGFQALDMLDRRHIRSKRSIVGGEYKCPILNSEKPGALPLSLREDSNGPGWRSVEIC